MWSRGLMLVLAVVLTAAIGGVDFLLAHDVSIGLLYFIPVGICAWHFGRATTIVFCLAVGVVRTLFVPNPCLHYISGTRMMMPHLCYEYVFGTIIRVLFYVLGGLVINLVRDQRRSIERLGWEALTDSLTGLYNRRFLEAKLKEEKARADRHKRPIAILMCDIDHFKAFNDTHGHQKGDELLTKVGNMLRKHVREIDVVCRYGGEEFLIVLPETDERGAMLVAERLRAAVGGADFGVSHPVTISIGVAGYPKDASSPEMAILEADQALYRAKAAGRNQVCQAAPAAKATGGGM